MEDDTDSIRRKRSKYVSKACVECKRRKIKCDGDYPCLHCQTVNTSCEYVEGKARGGARRTIPQQLVDGSGDHYYLNEIFGRLQTVEERLDTLLDRSDTSPDSPAVPHRMDDGVTSHLADRGVFRSPSGPVSRTIVEPPGYHGGCDPACGVPGIANRQSPNTTAAFYGHASSVGNVSNLRHQLTSFTSSTVLSQSQNPSTQCQLNEVYARQVARTTVLPPRTECFSILDTMFEDLISMYPLLHAPTFYRRYAPLWNARGEYLAEVAASDHFTLSELGLIYACLAASIHIIRSGPVCTREKKSSRAHSWYMAARTMVIDQKIDQVADLESIQAMLMLSLHFLHVENEDASYKVTGMAVRAGYEIGLHLAAREKGLSRLNIELRRRTWWCLYLMDRRTSISTGRPCGIQNRDSDVEYPTALDDRTLFPEQLETPILLENSKVPYLCQFVKFSSLCGEIYSDVFGVKCQRPPEENLVLAYDGKLEAFRYQLPVQLRFDQNSINLIPTWRAKQALFLMLRCAHVRLLLLRPFVTEPEAVNDKDHTLASVALRLSSEVIHTIYSVKKSSNLVESLWYPCKQILLGCIGITFWTVVNSRFASSSKADLRIALQLLKDFDEESSNQEDVQFLRYSLYQALKARNQTLLETNSQKLACSVPFKTPIIEYDLSFLGTPSELSEQQLLMSLLETSSNPSLDDFVMRGDDMSRKSMLSF